MRSAAKSNGRSRIRNWWSCRPRSVSFNTRSRSRTAFPRSTSTTGNDHRPLASFTKDGLWSFYNYECDLGDGWNDAAVHEDPPEKRDAALKMGTNVIVWALSH